MKIITYIKQVAAEFTADDVFKYSASLAYYTVFSVAPLLLIIISLSGFLFGKDAIEGQVYAQLNHLIGSVAAIQIQDTIKNIHLTGHSFFASILSIIILLIGATSIFGEIQDSFNKIWGLRVKTKRIWWKLILTRLLSFSLILSIGFIVIITLLMNTLVSAFGGFITRYIKGYSIYFIEITEAVLSFAVSAILFSLLFKILPDAKIKWKDVFIGGIVTALFFTLGKLGIGFYLGKSNIGTIYGAAGSIIIFMLWVYYSSVILYLGAEFTKVYAKLYGGKIVPNEYAEWIIIQEKRASSPQLKNKDLS